MPTSLDTIAALPRALPALVPAVRHPVRLMRQPSVPPTSPGGQATCDAPQCTTTGTAQHSSSTPATARKAVRHRRRAPLSSPSSPLSSPHAHHPVSLRLANDVRCRCFLHRHRSLRQQPLRQLAAGVLSSPVPGRPVRARLRVRPARPTNNAAHLRQGRLLHTFTSYHHQYIIFFTYHLHPQGL
jgi:hypothetical protein